MVGDPIDTSNQSVPRKSFLTLVAGHHQVWATLIEGPCHELNLPSSTVSTVVECHDDTVICFWSLFPVIVGSGFLIFVFDHELIVIPFTFDFGLIRKVVYFKVAGHCRKAKTSNGDTVDERSSRIIDSN